MMHERGSGLGIARPLAQDGARVFLCSPGRRAEALQAYPSGSGTSSTWGWASCPRPTCGRCIYRRPVDEDATRRLADHYGQR
jgi:NAD(P)-dependent dehydrogenase (short-subunit alcohol dehydrogenase family)